MNKLKLAAIIAIVLIVLPNVVFGGWWLYRKQHNKHEAQSVMLILAETEWITENSTVIRFNSDGTAAMDVATGDLYMKIDTTIWDHWMIGNRYVTLELSADKKTLDVVTRDGFQWSELDQEVWKRQT